MPPLLALLLGQLVAIAIAAVARFAGSRTEVDVVVLGFVLATFYLVAEIHCRLREERP